MSKTEEGDRTVERKTDFGDRERKMEQGGDRNQEKYAFDNDGIAGHRADGVV